MTRQQKTLITTTVLFSAASITSAYFQSCDLVKEAYKGTCCGATEENKVLELPKSVAAPFDSVDTLVEAVRSCQMPPGNPVCNAIASAPLDPPISWMDGPSVRTDTRPNVILFYVDDLGYNDVSFTNKAEREADASFPPPTVRTPAIDAVAAEGAVFTRGYAGAPTCSPSRSSLMTGRYPMRNGHYFTPAPDTVPSVVNTILNVRGNPPPEELALLETRVYTERSPLLNPQGNMSTCTQVSVDINPPMSCQGTPTEEVFVSEVLKDGGYYTAHLGKWHLGLENGMDPRSQGFTESIVQDWSFSMGHGLLQETDTIIFDPNSADSTVPGTKKLVTSVDKEDIVDRTITSSDRDQYLTFSDKDGNEMPFRASTYSTDFYTDQAIDIINKHTNDPFFIYLSHWGVHNPNTALRADYDKFAWEPNVKKRIYYAMIHAIDRSMQRLTDTLKEKGLYENTVIIFSSDNGGTSGVTDVLGMNEPFRGWKFTPFEGGIRVPFFVKAPGVPAGTVVDAMVHAMDVMPTIVDSVGLSMPADGKIRDGKSLLPIANGTSTDNVHDTLVWKAEIMSIIMTEQYKLIESKDLEGNTVQKLYDLGADRGELTNLAADPAFADEMTALISTRESFTFAPALWQAYYTTALNPDNPAGASVDYVYYGF